MRVREQHLLEPEQDGASLYLLRQEVGIDHRTAPLAANPGPEPWGSSGMRFIAVNPPERFQRTLGQPPSGATQEKTLKGVFDLVLLFVLDKKAL